MSKSKEKILQEIVRRLEANIAKMGEQKAVSEALKELHAAGLTMQMLSDYRKGYYS